MNKKNSTPSDTIMCFRKGAVLFLFFRMFVQGRGYFTAQDVDHFYLLVKRHAAEIQLSDIALKAETLMLVEQLFN